MLGKQAKVFSLRGWSSVLGIGVLGIAGMLVSCGGDSKKTSTTSAPRETTATRVNVTMKEWSITPSLTSVKAGEVRFFAKNTGQALHELVVVKSDADPAKLPIYGASDTPAEGHQTGDVDEAQITSEGEVEDIEIGSTKDATFVLEPGKYVLICNLPSHYGQGMHVAFTVK